MYLKSSTDFNINCDHKYIKMINDGLQDDLINAKEEKVETFTEFSSKEPELKCGKTVFTEKTHCAPKKSICTSTSFVTPSPSYE